MNQVIEKPLRIAEVRNFCVSKITACEFVKNDKSVLQGFVYWSDAVTQSICRASKHNGRNLMVLLSNTNSPGGVAIIQSALQPKGVMNQVYAPRDSNFSFWKRR